ncbi:MAG TPA: DUF3775 domain-containing protein [Gammaproteobacteria bacterium]|nr:DUF3775 domain-containing protein [Gammaproteobacteria bacterium]
MLDLNPETVEQIIDRAHQFQTRDGMQDDSDDDETPDIDALAEMVLHDPDDPVYLELKSAIDDLEPDQQVSLVALMWLGRGDFTIDDWDQALSRAGEEWNNRTADYLLRTPLLGDYLSEGLEQIQDYEP